MAAGALKDTAELGRQWKPQAPEHGKEADSSEDGRSGLTPRPFDLCVHDRRSGGGFDRGFAAEDGG